MRYRGFLAGACASGCLLHSGFENTSSLQTIPHTVGDEVIGLGSGPGRWDSSELRTAVIVISGGAIISA